MAAAAEYEMCKKPKYNKKELKLLVDELTNKIYKILQDSGGIAMNPKNKHYNIFKSTIIQYILLDDYKYLNKIYSKSDKNLKLIRGWIDFLSKRDADIKLLVDLKDGNNIKGGATRRTIQRVKSILNPIISSMIIAGLATPVVSGYMPIGKILKPLSGYIFETGVQFGILRKPCSGIFDRIFGIISHYTVQSHTCATIDTLNQNTIKLIAGAVGALGGGISGDLLYSNLAGSWNNLNKFSEYIVVNPLLNVLVDSGILTIEEDGTGLEDGAVSIKADTPVNIDAVLDHFKINPKNRVKLKEGISQTVLEAAAGIGYLAASSDTTSSIARHAAASGYGTVLDDDDSSEDESPSPVKPPSPVKTRGTKRRAKAQPKTSSRGARRSTRKRRAPTRGGMYKNRRLHKTTKIGKKRFR